MITIFERNRRGGEITAVMFLKRVTITVDPVLTRKGLEALGGADKLNLTDFILRDCEIDYTSVLDK